MRPEAGISLLFKRVQPALWGIFLLSAALNILLLGGALYMMLVYDMVLPAGSLPTLVGLLLLVILVYAFQCGFDIVRARLLGRASALIDHQLNADLFAAIHALSVSRPGQGDNLAPIRDLDQLRNFLSSGAPLAVADLPWMIFFILVLTLMHWTLGLTVLLGGAALLLLAIMAERLMATPTQRLTQQASLRLAVAETVRRHAEAIRAMAMGPHLQRYWTSRSSAFLQAQEHMADSAAALGSLSKTLRMLLQSLVLTVGALLVIEGKATGGIMFASSILASRALAPVEQTIGNWRGLTAARQGWRRLKAHLADIPPEPAGIALPAPRRSIAAEHLTVIPPGAGRPTLAGVSFQLEAGDALGIVGPSGSGKSSLLRTLCGIWPPAQGRVRLDGAALEQYSPATVGKALGYLPQNVELLDGTVAENIARFSLGARSDDIIRAAQAAGVHEMVKHFPKGYETPVGPNGTFLSAGQRQRVALARALFGEPFLLILDEPNSNLDPEGEAALAAAVEAVRDGGGIVLLVAHRRSILSVTSRILELAAGRVKNFGSRERVLENLTKG